MDLKKIRQDLIAGLRMLDMRKEPVIVVMPLLRTEKQLTTMMDWIATHYEQHPDEDRIIAIARAINETIQ